MRQKFEATIIWNELDLGVDLGLCPELISDRQRAGRHAARRNLRPWRRMGPSGRLQARPNDSLKYPGDPPLRPLAMAKLREEELCLITHRLLSPWFARGSIRGVPCRLGLSLLRPPDPFAEPGEACRFRLEIPWPQHCPCPHDSQAERSCGAHKNNMPDPRPIDWASPPTTTRAAGFQLKAAPWRRNDPRSSRSYRSRPMRGRKRGAATILGTSTTTRATTPRASSPGVLRSPAAAHPDPRHDNRQARGHPPGLLEGGA